MFAETQYAGRSTIPADELKAAYAGRRDLRPSDVATFTFPMFMEAIGEEDPVSMDRHWQPQTLVACMNLITYDLVAQVEDMDRRAPEVTTRIGAGLPMAIQMNRRRRAQQPVRDLFGDKETEIVRRVYAADFRRFRYDPAAIPEFDL